MSQINSSVLECFCQKEISFEKSEIPIFSHLKSCKVYQQNSPIYTLFCKLNIAKMDKTFLITLKNEFLSYVDQIQVELENGYTKEKFCRVKQSINQKNQKRKNIINIVEQENQKEIHEIIDSDLEQNYEKLDQINGPSKKPKIQNQIDLKLDDESDLIQSPVFYQNQSSEQKKTDKIETSLDNELQFLEEEKGEQMKQQDMENEQHIQCQLCKSSYLDIQNIWYLVNCFHVFCRSCLQQQIEEEYIKEKGEINCKICQKSMDQQDLNEIQGQQKMEQLQNQIVEQQLNIVTCQKCLEKFDFTCGNQNENIKNASGKILSKEHQHHYADFRFLCKNNACKTEQCKKCKAIPYHLGLSCEEHKKHQDSIRCRYCDLQINSIQEIQAYQQKNLRNNQVSKLPFKDICTSEECQEKGKDACQKQNQCGHQCLGVNGEKECPPCIFQDCALKNEQEQNNNDLCNICYIESLQAAPIIKASCGHIFHYQCIKKRLETKWVTPRIVFNFCFCPLCNQWLNFPKDSILQQQMEQNQKLYNQITEKSMKRLEYEERLKDQKLTNKNSPYFEKPQEYALALYSYYQCFKCKNSYFGGLKDCERNIDELQQNFDPNNLICPNCCQVPMKDCQKHGKEFIDFKCRYCCSLALWFCFGNTHFCDPCHRRAYDFQNKKVQIPQCKGKEFCPLKVDHAQNGTEHSLGCSLCRNLIQEAKEF